MSLWMAALVLLGPVQDDKGGKVQVDLGGGVKMEFIRIKAGTFTMGSAAVPNEEPAHAVTLTKDFWLQTTEATQAQWEAVMGANPSKFKGDNLPVESVAWEDCQEFLKKLNEKAKESLGGKRASLPTEAEWEYACRAGRKEPPKGHRDLRLNYAWFEPNSERKTHPVARLLRNEWGLYDMNGNVAEWCEDEYGPYEKGEAKDPRGPSKGDGHVLRGGSYISGSFGISFTGRTTNKEKELNFMNGLRVALHE